LHWFLGNQKDVAGNRVFYENGDFITQYSIVNWLSLQNGSLVLKYVGSTKTVQNLLTFNIKVEKIIWKNSINKIPRSQCSENCLPGTWKVLKSRIYSCCYDCVQCSSGEISNATDSQNCKKCSDLDWPNERKDRCVPKLQDFLSYTDDTIVLVVSLVSTLLSFLTFMILITFILHQDTAIVKANNRNLSFLLLVSIMLSFLCVFLFLGHPVDLTCMLRQVSFGILFSVAVSCVLSKTIMVCIAFRAMKPGSSWKRWIGSKWSNSLVLFCSSIQVMICLVWLTLAPPFPELDTHSNQEKIIVQCNEGSVIGFYSVVGYMGVLAIISFIMAFLARTLPDSFNEAKYITFSMLVFCSVWIAMIPAYLSTKGKYMVAVEIFAILTSSAGVLGCIFFPKCYIIMWRPELNTRSHLLEGRGR
ncbi:vomeronasal type-2 receptor 26-like, partial [Bufo gargarizans]|uniref:vomeronasal type-2 receptor 26-like n=1 Tax=Bufo gargarizans TaxID=30331 RepID=UPI001CF31D32